MYVIVEDSTEIVVLVANKVEVNTNNLIIDDETKINNTNLMCYKLDDNIQLPKSIRHIPSKYKYNPVTGFTINKAYSRIALAEIAATLEELALQVDPTLIDSTGYTLNEMKDYQNLVVSHVGQKYIENGIDVELKVLGTTQHFSFTSRDQLNLFIIYNSITPDVKEVAYHADKSECMAYHVEDFKHIFLEYRLHLLFHTTLINQVHQYIRCDLEDIDKVAMITYDQTILPDKRILTLLTIMIANGISLGVSVEDITKFIIKEFRDVLKSKYYTQDVLLQYINNIPEEG